MTEGRSSARDRHAVEVPARLAYHGCPSTAAVARVVEHARPRRITAALRILGLCWLIAAATVFVPLGHFFLVPAFLIAGPVLAAQKLVEARTLVGARGECPGCGHVQTFEDRGRLGERFSLRCAECRREIFLEPHPLEP